MILKRSIVASDVAKQDSKVSSLLTVAYASPDGAVQVGGFHVYHISEADRWARQELASMGLSVSQIIASDFCTEEKLLVALAETQDKLARLVLAVEGFAGYPEDYNKPDDRVLETPESFVRISMTEEERAEYTTLYNATLEAAGVCCEAEPLLSRVASYQCEVCRDCGREHVQIACPCDAGINAQYVKQTRYIVWDALTGEKDGTKI